MRRIASIALLVGCGRIDFAARSDAGPQGSDAVTITYGTHYINAAAQASTVMMTPRVTGDPTAFTVTPAFPPGLVLDPATGVISGMPQVAAMYPFTITATGAAGSGSVMLQGNIQLGFAVDTTADGADDDGGTDGTCFSTAAGGCSLRAAIQSANRHFTIDMIVLPAGTYVLGSAVETVMNNLLIAGAGPTLTTIQPSTLHPGYNFASLTTGYGLALYDLHLDGFGSVNGGAISVTNGSFAAGEVDFTRNDSAGSGGVLFINGGMAAQFFDCTFENNTSFGGNQWGGVIDGEGASTKIEVYNSTATSNSTGWGSFSHITTGTTLLLQNSTLYGNTATISGTLASPGGVYTLVNDTIAYNTNTYATPNDSNLTSGGIYLYSPPAAYTLTNVLLAHNTIAGGGERNCSHRLANTPLTSMGGNVLTDDGYNCATDFATDRLSTDPGLDPAAPSNHGGLTPTMLLVPGSASVDTGVLANCPKTDQRGVARPIGITCDVGAIEME